jgi:MSHA biogenesis protein MshQ
MVAQAVTATGVNALGYNGTPQITATVAAQSVSAQSVTSPVTTTDYTDRLKDGNVNSVALFNSGSASSGQANASLFYLDYGGFRILANGVKDTAYVDAALDVPGKDCVSGSSSNVDADPDPDRELFGCVVANQSNSALVGRFYPNSFSLTSSSITQACVAGAFSYEGQPFAVNAAVSALSNGTVVAAAVMPRYTAGVVTFAAENNNAGTDLAARLSGLAGAWVNGVYTVAASSVVFSRLVAADGPFDALDLGISVVDATDALNLGAARNMLPTNATACTSATCTHQKMGGAIKMRYGRLRMSNAYGSELLALPVAFEAQYWGGNYYATHTVDSCTSIPMSSITMGNYLGNLSACETQMSPTGSVTLSAGKLPGAGLVLSTPGAGNGGSVDLAINVTAVAAGNTCVGPTESAATAAAMPWFGPNQGARATFGLYKSPLIYRRENY